MGGEQLCTWVFLNAKPPQETTELQHDTTTQSTTTCTKRTPFTTRAGGQFATSAVIWRMKNSQPVSPKMAHKRAKTMHVEHMDSAVTEARDQKKMHTGLQYRRIRRSLLEPANATPAPTGSADIND